MRAESNCSYALRLPDRLASGEAASLILDGRIVI